MKSRFITGAALFAMVFAVASFAAKPAQAQYFTNHDGYTDSGGERVQVELDPYLWWPGLSGSVHFASPLVSSRNSGDFNTGLFSLSDILHTLHFAFMGSGIVRYGPYSAELDLQYLSVSQSETLFTTPQGGDVRVNSALQLLRIAPGVGYQVYAGNVYGIPTSVDARVGFAYFTTWQNYTGEGVLAGRNSSSNTDFIQPWLGGRIDFIPAPRWRIELSALVQGFGVDGGSWGWGATGGVSYAINDWVSVNLAARALRTERFGLGRTAFGQQRSISLITYGPLIGVGFRFPPPSSPPPPTPAPVAAPAPAPAKTYLVFFDWDKTALTPRATQIIAEAASDSHTNQVTTIDVSGYTDTSGSAVYNQGLSVRRGQAVAAQLVSDGVSASEISVQGFGDTHLLVPTGPGVREPQNRRVEIVLQ
jgi:OmpA family